jgi:hypothetical protein
MPWAPAILMVDSLKELAFEHRKCGGFAVPQFSGAILGVPESSLYCGYP